MLNHLLNITLAIMFVIAADMAFKMLGALAFFVLVPAGIMLVCLIQVTSEEGRIRDEQGTD